MFVSSPIAMLNQELSLRTVTFTQDNESGTLTTIDAVAPWQLNDEGPTAVHGSGLVPASPLTPVAPMRGVPPTPESPV